MYVQVEGNLKLQAHTSDSSYLICYGLALKSLITAEKVELAPQELPGSTTPGRVGLLGL